MESLRQYAYLDITQQNSSKLVGWRRSRIYEHRLGRCVTTVVVVAAPSGMLKLHERRTDEALGDGNRRNDKEFLFYCEV